MKIISKGYGYIHFEIYFFTGFKSKLIREFQIWNIAREFNGKFSVSWFYPRRYSMVIQTKKPWLVKRWGFYRRKNGWNLNLFPIYFYRDNGLMLK